MILTINRYCENWLGNLLPIQHLNTVLISIKLFIVRNEKSEVILICGAKKNLRNTLSLFDFLFTFNS